MEFLKENELMNEILRYIQDKKLPFEVTARDGRNGDGYISYTDGDISIIGMTDERRIFDEGFPFKCEAKEKYEEMIAGWRNDIERYKKEFYENEGLSEEEIKDAYFEESYNFINLNIMIKKRYNLPNELQSKFDYDDTIIHIDCYMSDRYRHFIGDISKDKCYNAKEDGLLEKIKADINSNLELMLQIPFIEIN